MSEDIPAGKGLVTAAVSGLSEKILESKAKSNALIIVLVLIFAISFLSIGIGAIRGAAPLETEQLSQ